MNPFASLFMKKKRREVCLGERQAENRAIEDGARLLQELISTFDGNCFPIHIFSAKELREAVDDSYFSMGAYSEHYKGTYQDRQIFIKRYRRYREYAFREIATITQINHRNVVKLLGCCFEMEWPLLIYEFVPNSLLQLLRYPNLPNPISWENRLRIAIEIADALTYLHTANPQAIVHRDMHCQHILLDEHSRPKLCGFTLSVAIPSGETHLELADEATSGGFSVPPETMAGIVSEKTDVYAFGWLLLEILSGKEPRELKIEGDIRKGCTIEELGREKKFSCILDSRLSLDEKKVKQSKAWVDLAIRCLSNAPDRRPTMKEVAQKFRQIERYELPLLYCEQSNS